MVVSNRNKGHIAETHAAAFLRRRGCTLLARNYAYRGGELDIVAKDRVGKILFVEVKSIWNKDKGAPASRVKGKKQFKIWRTACHFLHFHGGQDQASRFHVVSIDLSENKRNIRYYPGAFEAKATIADC